LRRSALFLPALELSLLARNLVEPGLEGKSDAAI
jgi:hypothetical protein